MENKIHCDTCDFKYEPGDWRDILCPRCAELYTKYPELEEYVKGLRASIKKQMELMINPDEDD